jgi:DNA-binding beta-propeller fold protein YncE/DNA-directed RNA polymerase subunit RPC12/RpoP
MAGPSSPASPQLFHCPTCGASLPVPDEDPSVRCEYCGSTVLVPPEYRQQPEASEARPPVVIQISGAPELQAIDLSGSAPARSRSVAGISIALVIICLVVGVIGAVMAATGAFTTAAVVNQSVRQVITQAATPPAVLTEMALLLATPSPDPDYSFALQFGAAGTGPGQFDDARYLAVDPDGNIYTAEYQDGRLQSFDPQGKFQQLINVEPDDADYSTISDLASDYKGRLLVARRGDILIYDLASGAAVGSIPGEFPGTWYDALAIDPANTIYALHTSAGDLDLIKINPNGQVAWRKPQITAGLVKNTEISTVRRLAVDGLGNIYLLDDSQNQVYQYDADGNFVDRFGSEGDGPGLLASPEDLTVDGQGRVYVLDQDGIEIFDNNGAPVKLIPDDYDGHAFDIKLDLAGNVYIITNAPQVYKLKLNFGE